MLAIAAVVPFVGIVLAHADVVPMFDSGLYAECVNDALRAGDPRGLNCFGHPTIGYLLPVALARLSAPGCYGAVIVLNALLGGIALLALCDIVKVVFPAEDRAADRWLLVVAFAVHPILLSAALNLTPDFGVTVFFLLTLRGLLCGSIVGTALAGTALTFSKEPGVVLYLLATGIHTLLFVVPSGPQRLRRLLRSWPLAVPPALLILFYVARSSGAWVNPVHPSTPLIEQVLRLNLFVFLAYCATIFVLQFTWVPTSVIVAHVALCARAALARKPLRFTREERFVWLLFGGAAVTWIAFPTFVNARYFLPLAPLLLLCVGSALGAIDPPRPVLRAGVIAAVAALFLVSAFRTVDPLSRAIFGTFPFGKRTLLYMTSITHECCGFGRDQMVYNVEFTQLHRLVEDVYARFPLEPGTRYAAGEVSDWHLMDRIDDGGRRRTIDWRDSPASRACSSDSIAAAATRPRRVYFIDFPFMWSERDLRILEQGYDVKRVHWVERSGYGLRVLEMTARPQWEPRGTRPLLPYEVPCES